LRYLAENVAGGVGHGRAEAENVLLRCSGVEDDGFGCHLGGRSPGKGLAGGVAAIAEAAPDADAGGRLRENARAVERKNGGRCRGGLKKAAAGTHGHTYGSLRNADELPEA